MKLIFKSLLTTLAWFLIIGIFTIMIYYARTSDITYHIKPIKHSIKDSTKYNESIKDSTKKHSDFYLKIYNYHNMMN